MTIKKQMKREDLVALIREGERKERVRDAAEPLLKACKALVKAIYTGHEYPMAQAEEAIAKAEGKEEDR